MAKKRIRERTSVPLDRYRQNNGDGVISAIGTFVACRERTEDTVHNASDRVNGRYPPAEFLNRKTLLEQPITYSNPNGNGYTVKNFHFHAYNNQSGTTSAEFPSRKTTLSSADWNRILRSGPNTARMNLPLALLELRELPMMLRHAGDLLHGFSPAVRRDGLSPIRQVASTNLAYKFGWTPLIDDLFKLLDFADHAEKRYFELANARTSKGLRRTVKLDGHTATVRREGFSTPSSFGIGDRFSYSTTIECESRIWASVRWRVRDTADIGKPVNFNHALRSALGLTKGGIPITVWKALPWTWMTDWFANVSHLLEANHNLIDYEPFNVCLMEHRTKDITSNCTAIHTKGGQGWVPIGNLTNHAFNSTLEEKFRRPFKPPSSLGLTIGMPHWDSYKLSVLASLTVLGLIGKTG